MLLHPYPQPCRQKHTPPVWTPKEDEAEDVDDATKALAALALKLELEDSAELADDTEEGLGVDEDLEADDNDNGLGDEHEGTSEEDVAELEESLVLIQLMLTKVSRFKLSSEII